MIIILLNVLCDWSHIPIHCEIFPGHFPRMRPLRQETFTEAGPRRCGPAPRRRWHLRRWYWKGTLNIRWDRATDLSLRCIKLFPFHFRNWSLFWSPQFNATYNWWSSERRTLAVTVIYSGFRLLQRSWEWRRQSCSHMIRLLRGEFIKMRNGYSPLYSILDDSKHSLAFCMAPNQFTYNTPNDYNTFYKLSCFSFLPDSGIASYTHYKHQCGNSKGAFIHINVCRKCLLSNVCE